MQALVPQQPTSMAHQAETASTAMAAAAAATVQARYVMAIQRPRSIDQVRAKILQSCQRPAFAEVAIYERPVGKKKNQQTGDWEESFIRGPSIRFAEEAARQYGNILVQSPVLFEDADKRVIRVTATDLETNFCWEKDITVSKTVERRNLKKGQTAKGTRVNSYGDTIYIVEATDEELETKAAAHISKAARTCILRLIPGDLLEEGMSQCDQTMANKDAEDPQSAKKKVVDGFAKLNIMPNALVAYLGHALDTVTPAELTKLRGLFASLRDGVTTWGDVMAEVNEARTGAADGKTQTQRTAEILDQKRQAAPPANVDKPAAAPAKTETPPPAGDAAKKPASARKGTPPGQQASPTTPATTRGTFFTEEELRDEARAANEKAAAQDEEPAHDPATGEVTDGREPGSEG